MHQNTPIGEVIVSPVNPRHLDPNNLSDEDERKIAELMQSIREHGILTPLIGRREENGKIGIGAGQRRLIAGRRIGIEKILVDVRDLDDAQMLRVALTEQLQRDNLHPLDEAQAYEELLGSPALASGAEVAALGVSIGKEPSYIRRRLQLRLLAPRAVTAFRAGDIDETKALALARLPSTKVQEKVLGMALKADRDGDTITSRGLLRVIRDEHYNVLEKAPFDPADPTLVVKAGSCLSCPKNTATQPDLFDKPELETTGVCTDEDCYRGKATATFELKATQAKKEGVKVLSTKQAEGVYLDDLAHDGTPRVKYDSPYVDLDSKHWDPTNNTEKKWRTIVGAQLKAGEIQRVLAQAPDGSTRELVPKAEANAIAQSSKRSAAAKSVDPKTKEKNRAERKENELLRTVAEEAVRACVRMAASKGEAAALTLAARTAPLYGVDEDIAGIIGVKDVEALRTDRGKLTVPQLRQVVTAGALAGASSLTGGKFRDELVLACKLLGVDLRHIEKEVRRAGELAKVATSADPEAMAQSMKKASKAGSKKKAKAR